MNKAGKTPLALSPTAENPPRTACVWTALRAVWACLMDGAADHRQAHTRSTLRRAPPEECQPGPTINLNNY